MKQRRFLSVLLALCLVLGMLPGTVFAAGSKLSFTDVKTADWYYDAVQYVYEKGMMTGTGADTFSPNSTTSRGMIVTILHRLEGTPSATGAAFTDVPAGQWYTDAVAWASANEIVGGYGNGKFGPDDPITREQMATILYRYSRYKDYDTTVSGSLSGFPDAAKTSSYAADAMGWAVGTGLIAGMDDGTLAPQGSATRAQAATIFMRYCENVIPAGEPDPDKPASQTYTVTFAYNYGGQGTYKTLTVKAGETVASPADPSRSGYTFDGWYTSASGGSKFDFDSAITGDITLYAKWSVNSGNGNGNGGGAIILPTHPSNSYTVTFDSNGGSAVESQTVAAGETAIEPITPYRAEYTFSGWYSDPDITNIYDFTKPVTSDIILYAKWEGSDNLVDIDSKEVDADDAYALTASKREVLAESNTDVLFYVNSTLTLSTGFELYCEGEPTGIVLYDDGDYNNHHDDIPNDGCYTGVYTINIAEEKDISFTAVATVGTTKISTNTVEIFVYYELTNAQIAQMESISAQNINLMEQAIAALDENATEAEKTKARHDAVWTYLETLRSDGTIESLEYNEDSSVISYVYTETGIEHAVLCSEEMLNNESKSDGEITPIISDVSNDAITTDVSNEDVIIQSLDSININYITYREKAISLCYSAESEADTFVQSVQTISTLLEDAGFDSTITYSVTVDDFKNLNDYNYIYVECHGSTLGFFNKVPVICTAQAVTSSNKKTYSADLKKGRIDDVDTTHGTRYWIKPDFFTFYYAEQPLKSPIVTLGSCKGAINTKLVDAIVAAGANAVTAYSDTVYTWYDYYMQIDILTSLLTGDSISEAVTKAKNENGIDDLTWGANQYANGNQNFKTLKSERAVCNVYGNSSARIHHSLLNGDFDSVLNILNSQIASWQQYGDARSIYKLSGILPQSFYKMAIISSGFGSQNDETTSCIYQTFLVPSDAMTIEFSYDVVSEEPMEFVGSIYNDIFQVDILTTDGDTLETLACESVNTSDWYAVSGIDFPGGDSTTYHTRWQSVSSDVIQKYRNRLVVLRFTVQDAGDAIYDTAALIDSVSIK